MNTNPKKHSGAALVSVIVVMLILSALLMSASNILNSRLNLADESLNALEQRVAITSHINYMGYILSTQRDTLAGISEGTNPRGAERVDVDWKYQIIGDEIRADGFHNKLEVETLTYSLQDVNGLIAINTNNNFWKSRWLDALDVSGIDQRKMLDALADYSDPDDRNLPAGAESADYEASNLTPPTNYLLQTCTELYSVIRWQAFVEQNNSILEQCSLGRRPVLNINAVPEPLLILLWPRYSESIMNARASGSWFSNQYTASSLVPEFAKIQDDFISFIPSNRFKLSYYKNNTPIVSLYLERGSGAERPVSFYSAPAL